MHGRGHASERLLYSSSLSVFQIDKHRKDAVQSFETEAKTCINSMLGALELTENRRRRRARRLLRIPAHDARLVSHGVCCAPGRLLDFPAHGLGLLSRLRSPGMV